MKNYSENITPDALTGGVFALEGIRRSVVILNSPTGCKFYHSAVSDSQFTRENTYDPLKYPEVYYFGQPRVPCTYLDSHDYVYGSKDKLEDILEFVSRGEYELAAIINSPGAALIGDDLQGIARRKLKGIPHIVIENPGFSTNYYTGFQDAVIELMKKLPLETGTSEELSVNIIGLSIYNKYFQGDKKEIETLLSHWGIKVNCFISADTTLQEIKNIPRAAMNIILYPELGTRVAVYLKEKYNMPYYMFEKGLPVGFYLTEQYVYGIIRELKKYGDVDEKSGMESFTCEIEKARADAFIPISRLNSLTGYPKGSAFSIETISSASFGYLQFFMYYFGMVPRAVKLEDDGMRLYKKEIRELLNKHGLSNVINKEIHETDSDIVFSNGSTIARLKLMRLEFTGIEIALPTLGYTDVIPKTHLGIQGSLLLTEQIINSF